MIAYLQALPFTLSSHQDYLQNSRHAFQCKGRDKEKKMKEEEKEKEIATIQGRNA